MLNGFNIGYPKNKQFCQYYQDVYNQVMIDKVFCIRLWKTLKAVLIDIVHCHINLDKGPLILLLLRRELSIRFQQHCPPKINLGKLHYVNKCVEVACHWHKKSNFS